MNDVGVDVSAAGARSTSLSDTASLYQLPVDIQTLSTQLSQWNGCQRIVSGRTTYVDPLDEHADRVRKLVDVEVDLLQRVVRNSRIAICCVVFGRILGELMVGQGWEQAGGGVPGSGALTGRPFSESDKSVVVWCAASVYSAATAC